MRLVVRVTSAAQQIPTARLFLRINYVYTYFQSISLLNRKKKKNPMQNNNNKNNVNVNVEHVALWTRATCRLLRPRCTYIQNKKNCWHRAIRNWLASCGLAVASFLKLKLYCWTGTIPTAFYYSNKHCYMKKVGYTI